MDEQPEGQNPILWIPSAQRVASLTHLRRERLPERPAEHDVDCGEVGDGAADGDHGEAHALTETDREREKGT